MRSNRHPSRAALSLLEVIIVLGILATLFGLLFPAVQQVRAVASRASCFNQMKQIGLATHQFAGERSGRLPRLGGNEGDGRGLFFVLLPYLEHGDYYVKTKESGVYAGNYVMKQYLCPVDPSIEWQFAEDRISYAANAQVFLDQPPGLPRTFRDGTSTTIAFAEHYSMCPGQTFSWFLTDSLTIPPSPDLPNGLSYRRAAFADYLPGTVPYNPDVHDVHPVSAGGSNETTGSIPLLTFQYRPTVAQADGRVAQTAHTGGMVVGMGDASVRIMSPRASPRLYWALVTPTGGESVSLE